MDTSTLHERVYHHLRQAIASGMLQPGQPVTLRGVAEALGTSMMPVREAVRLLVFEQVLEMPTSRSVRVRPLSARRFDNLIAMRKLIEGSAAARAAEVATADDLAVLEGLQERMEAEALSKNVASFMDANRRFHFHIYGLPEDDLLVTMIESLWLQAGPYVAAVLAEGYQMNFAPDDHHSLLSALRLADPAAASSALKSDIATTAEAYKRCLGKLPID